jgi:hypothetical protein
VHVPDWRKQVVAFGAFPGVGHGGKIGPAVVQLGHRFGPRAELELDIEARLLRGQGDHLDVEALGPALRVLVLEGREVGVARVDEATALGSRPFPLPRIALRADA